MWIVIVTQNFNIIWNRIKGQIKIFIFQNSPSWGFASTASSCYKPLCNEVSKYYKSQWLNETRCTLSLWKKTKSTTNKRYFEKLGWNRCQLINDKYDLGYKMPSSSDKVNHEFTISINDCHIEKFNRRRNEIGSSGRKNILHKWYA